MAAPTNELDAMPVVPSREDFDQSSGSLLERMIFNRRLLVVSGCLLLTAALGIAATRLEINASFEKMMPLSHPFIQNYRNNAGSLRGLGDSVRIVVENTTGDIYDPKYLEVLRKINDQVFLIPGVDRSLMKSPWMPIVRWTEITEEGYKGGADLIPRSIAGDVARRLAVVGQGERGHAVSVTRVVGRSDGDGYSAVGIGRNHAERPRYGFRRKRVCISQL